ncbi:hypothetical protein MJO55_28315 (plasmid) [Mycolicibacterium rufum]|uniref:ApeA N-terminal domain-containing protein n=1 Tax=Mycolicibacterium rufum TaxID=318424 RepID=A0ABY3UKC8_9MYCO|nr:HEPN domain-containing protein [Mycolicibacterium rufum]ULP40049.1 hypothetical protein MJO55_28315 [Mycolicibacterium rufum]
MEGTFWQIDAPERQVRGQLTIAPAPVLETLGPIFEERAFRIETSPQGGTTIIDGGNSDDLVADWSPRDIHGVLDNGREVSVIGAQGGMTDPSSSYPPQYRQRFGTIRHIIHDAHVDREHVFYAGRFRLTGPNWLRHADGHADTTDGGRLVSLNDGGSQWFEFTPAEPMSVLDYDRAVLHPTETLATLFTSHPAEAVELAVRQSPAGPWLLVHRYEQPAPTGHHELFDASYLTPQRCAVWIDFRRRSNGLDAAALDDLTGVAIQTSVLTLAAVAEGLHRRLYPDKKRVAALSRTDLRAARKAARVAALAAVRSIDRDDRPELTEADLTAFGEAMNNAFAFINESTFRTMMDDLVGTAVSAVPGIVAEFADWPAAIHSVRNILAHRGTEDDLDAHDGFINTLVAASYSLRWVLRTVLLVQAQVNPANIVGAYELSSAYHHHQTNVRELLAGTTHARR